MYVMPYFNVVKYGKILKCALALRTPVLHCRRDRCDAHWTPVFSYERWHSHESTTVIKYREQ